MWAPVTLFDWLVLGYLVLGLAVAGWVFHEINTPEFKDSVTKEVPAPPSMVNKLYAAVVTVLLVGVVMLWPIAAGYEAYERWIKR